MSNPGDTDIATLSDEEREILAFWMKQARQQKLLAQQIKPRQPTDNPPLSFAQQRLWVVDQMIDTGAAYTLTMGLHISGSLRIDVLEKCLGEIVRRHEVLRSSIDLRDGEPIQLIHPPAPVQVELTDLSGHSAEQVETATRKFHAEVGATVFDLARGPLMRSHLLRLTQQQHILVICMHHIVTDGWSFNLLQRELTDLYEAYLSGNSSPLAELPVQYADFAAWQRNWLAGDEYNRQLDYWRDQLKDLTTLELPTDRIRPALPSFKGGMAAIKLDTDLKHSLVKLAQQEDVTLFILLLAVFTLLLHKYSGQDDIVLGSPVANRSRIETEVLIGFFVNMLVLRTDLSGNPSFRELLGRVRDTAFEAYEHQDLPFERLVEELKVVRDVSRNPLFQISFLLQDAQGEANRQIADLNLRPVSVGNPSARFDLEFYLTEGNQDLSILAVYNTDQFDADTIERMLAHNQTLLAGIVVDPNRRISELSMLAESERRQLVEDWNQTSTAYPADKTVHELFEMQAAASPDAIALDYEGSRLSYAELNARANQLAHYLQARGVGPEVKVGLCLERSLEMIVALLGILKAGGAYLPLDPDYPESRLAYMLEDAQVPVLLSLSTLSERLADFTGERIYLDSDWATIAREKTLNPVSGATANNLIYVIYTSGSTGHPKGTLIEHRSAVRLVKQTNYVEFGPGEVFLQFAPVSFDASTFEIWGSLLNGARLVVFPAGLSALEELGQFIQQKGVTTLWLTSALFSQMVDNHLASLSGVRQLLAGGEALSLPRVQKVLEQLDGRRLINGYGPTENTTFTCCHVMTAGSELDQSVPIGRPISNTTVYILDGQMRPVPVGVPGELYIGGDGLARGYLNRAELTAEKFIADPFSDRAGARLYRTGDEVRYRSDGAIEFLGRFDNQLKLRGFRIEPGEIETLLARHPTVRDAAVVLHGVDSDDKRLVAYVVADNDALLTVTELRDHVRNHLPDYMLPSAFVFLDTLPLTPSGKVDRKALPRPQVQKRGRGSRNKPQTEMEIILVEIWEELLEIEDIETDDMFFDLGGHSLLTIKVIDRFAGETNVRIPVASFMSQTLRQIAASAEASLKASEKGPGNGPDKGPDKGSGRGFLGLFKK